MLNSVFQSISSNILTQPAYIVGLLVLVGMLALKKPWYEAISSMIKAVAGFLILNIGSGGFTSTFRPIVNALASKFNITASLIDTYTQQAQMNDPAEGFFVNYPDAMVYIAAAFVISIVVNFLLVAFNKYTKVRTLYTTGHVLQSYTMVWFWMIVVLCGSAAYTWPMAIMLGIFAGCWAAFGSNLTVEATQRLTGGANFAIGHQEMMGILVTEKLAPKLGKAEDSFDNLKLPGWLSIFTDNVVSTTVLMCVFMGVVMGFIGPETMRQFDSSLSPATWYFMYIFKTCVSFSMYMVVLLTGVRMMVGELTKAFRGFSDKLLKGSMPAVDCAVTYSFVSGNVPVLGFAMGLIGELIGIALLLVFKAPILLLPAFIPLFFDNATLACFANKAGGRKAAIIIPLINGLFQVVISELMLLFFQTAGGFHLNAWGAFFDNNTMLPILLVGSKLLNPIAIMAVLIVIMVVVTQLYYKKHAEHYWDHMSEM